MRCCTISCNDFVDLVVFIWTLFSVYFLTENGIKPNKALCAIKRSAESISLLQNEITWKN